MACYDNKKNSQIFQIAAGMKNKAIMILSKKNANQFFKLRRGGRSMSLKFKMCVGSMALSMLAADALQRYGMVIRVKPEMVAEYKRLHSDVWPEVLSILARHHVRNYSIFLAGGLLFGYLEYDGENYARDMKEIADEEITKSWWKLTDPCQEPFGSVKGKEWWAPMEEVFHMD